MVFGYDMILIDPFKTDWEAISKIKQELIYINNPENKKKHIIIE